MYQNFLHKHLYHKSAAGLGITKSSQISALTYCLLKMHKDYFTNRILHKTLLERNGYIARLGEAGHPLEGSLAD